MPIDSSIVSALAAVAGSLVGGSATIVTAWFTQRRASRREQAMAEIRMREHLYAEFVSECSKLAIDAFTNTLERPETMFPVFALLNRIRLVSSQSVIEEADRILRRISDQYFERNLSIAEMHELARSSANAEFLSGFSRACRDELKEMRLNA